MALKRQIEAMERIDFDSASLTASFQEMNTAGLSRNAQLFKMLSESTTAVDISYDGVNPHDRLPAGGSFVLDLSAGSENESAGWRKGQKVWLRGTAGTGVIYAIGYGQRGQ